MTRGKSLAKSTGAAGSGKKGSPTFPRKAASLQVLATDSSEVRARKFSALATSPEIAAYRAISAAEGKSSVGQDLDIPTLVDELRDLGKSINSGDMLRVESMLINQATALQSLFVRLTEKAMVADYMANFDIFMRMALRAQSQCRATLETLATIKNPPIVYARQANVTTGPQQVNNGIPTRTREIESEPSKLSEGSYELHPDAGTSGPAGNLNSEMETMGKIDRANDASR